MRRARSRATSSSTWHRRSGPMPRHATSDPTSSPPSWGWRPSRCSSRARPPACSSTTAWSRSPGAPARSSWVTAGSPPSIPRIERAPDGRSIGPAPAVSRSTWTAASSDPMARCGRCTSRPSRPASTRRSTPAPWWTSPTWNVPTPPRPKTRCGPSSSTPPTRSSSSRRTARCGQRARRPSGSPAIRRPTSAPSARSTPTTAPRRSRPSPSVCRNAARRAGSSSESVTPTATGSRWRPSRTTASTIRSCGASSCRPATSPPSARSRRRCELASGASVTRPTSWR